MVRGWQLTAVTTAVTILSGLLAPAAIAATYPIESAFAAAGPAAVAGTTVGSTYQIFYPADLATGSPRPIVTWGNGTGAAPADYAGVLHQLASWGFVVIAPTSGTTGDGTAILAAAQYLVARDEDPASIFHGRLDTTKVAAAGHSQGAGGSVRATLSSAGLIRTVVPIALPAPIFVSTPADSYDVSQLTVPVFFLGGQNDFICSPSTLATFYADVPGAAAKASLVNAGHNTIQGTGGGFLGYLTAWLRYQLDGDAQARAAFAGPAPELTGNGNWYQPAAKNLA